MAQWIFLLAFVSLSGFTKAQNRGLLEGRLPQYEPHTSNDIQIDQESPYSGDGKYWNSDDEDYAVSGSGSGSGAGVLDLDGPVDYPYNLTPVPRANDTVTPTTPLASSRPQSWCEMKRELSKSTQTSYVPSCLPNGDYAVLQCDGHPSTGTCWCADLQGNLIPNTLKNSNPPNCEKGYNLPKCTFEMVKSVRRQGLLGAPNPSCTEDGNFARKQCTGSICYCVDPITGEKEHGTQTYIKQNVNCDDESEDTGYELTTKRSRPAGNEQDIDLDENVWLPRGETDTIDLDESEENKHNRGGNDGEDEDFLDNETGMDNPSLPTHKFDKEGRDGEDSSEESDEDGSDDRHSGDGERHEHKDRVSRAGEILTQPGILAGVIGGAVVLLLLLVLLLMLLLYRMRKKDSGSYPLDEPHRNANNYAYVRAPDKEYYA